MTVVYETIIRPIVTEKSNMEMAFNKYTFLVNKVANKIEIKKAVEDIYKVKVKKVNVINSVGKKVQWGRKKGKKSDIKKAIVILQAGQKIKELTP